nr:hypothetical protein [Tanacetum cinerariifolium]
MMTDAIEQYMSKTRGNYGSGVIRPKINDKTHFELNDQYLKELCKNTFSGSEHEDAKEHIKKVLEIIDLFHIPEVTQDQVMLRVFHMSLIGAASRWLRNEPSGLITNWETRKIKFLNKYYLPARTAKKMEEINNFQQEPNENPLGKFDGNADEGFLVSKKILMQVKLGRKLYLYSNMCCYHYGLLVHKILRTQITNRVNAVSAPVTVAGPNSANSTNSFNTASPFVNVICQNFKITGKSLFMDPSKYPDDPDMPELEDIVYSDDEEDVGAEADLSNLETNIPVSPILTTRVHKDHPVTQIIGDLTLSPQKRSMTMMVKEQELKKVYQALKDPSWIESMQEEFLQFKMQKVWVILDLPKGKRAISSKWVFRNKKDERGIMIKNKARLMDVKSAFLYETIKEEVYVYQPPGFEALDYPDKELCKAFEKLMKDKFQMSSIGELTFFRITNVKSASTPIETKKPLLKDPDGEDVDVHIYSSVIGSLMYLTLSRPDIMFAVFACARFQVTPKVSHLHEFKRIFMYLKGKPHLYLWYPRDSPFNLVAYSDGDYAGASLDRKSTTRGYKGYLIKGKFCFIRGDDYISTSREALAL